jgi:hypothetical protein
MKALRGKILVKMDTRQKEKYSLTKDITIKIDRGFNFNRREDYPSRAEVIDGDGLPPGAPCLLHHNAIEKTYEIAGIVTEEERMEGIKVFSIPVDMCFCYFENDEWVPCKNFLITSRIFKPYKGSLVGIDPEQIKNRMYVVKGLDEWDGETKDLAGKVLVTLVNCDYQIIWHSKENREETLIRTRHREIIAIDEALTKEVHKGKYIVGVTHQTAKAL